MLLETQILTNNNGETSPCILLITKNNRYLFNVCEGIQRFCMENKIRMTKIDHVFLTELNASTIGGLPGMTLTIADIGNRKMNIYGPEGTINYLNATRHFLHRPEFELKGNDIMQDTILLKNDDVTISSIRLFDKLNDEINKPNNNNKQNNIAYIIKSADIPGKFLVKNAIQLGVPKGKMYGMLQKGKSVTLENGKIIHSKECMEPTISGLNICIFPCPDIRYINKLLKKNCTLFNKWTAKDNDTANHLDIIIHLASKEIYLNPLYISWIEKFGLKTKHIMVNHIMNHKKTNFRASAMLQSQLHFISPIFSKLPLFEENSNKDISIPLKLQKPNIFFGDPLFKYILIPRHQEGVDTTSCFTSLDFKDIKENLFELLKSQEDIQTNLKITNNNESRPPMAKISRNNQNSTMNENEISLPCKKPKCIPTINNSDESIKDMKIDLSCSKVIFLGTGSAIPSKYRNVTSIFIDINNVNGMLLDAGEGSYGQMGRIYEKLELDKKIINLKFIWISHNHADHHLGLIKIFTERNKLKYNNKYDIEPIFLVGPPPLKYWLEEYEKVDPMIENSYIFIHSMQFNKETNNRISPIYEEKNDNEEIALKNTFMEKIKQSLGIIKIDLVPVIHCHQAFGIAIEFLLSNFMDTNKKTYKIVFSGDCRPSNKLINVGNNCDLLIHEATFENDMKKEAKSKNHCTTSEAILVAKKMNAKFLFLTHFSQRYPKLPDLTITDEIIESQLNEKIIDNKTTNNDTNDNIENRIGIAFDLLTVRLCDLDKVSQYLPKYKILLNKSQIENEETIL